jgi:hypothetical protein
MSPVIASVSSIGTPALISCPIVCSERLMYSERNIVLQIGIVSFILSTQNAAHLGPRERIHRRPITAASPPRM